ncbi:MAG: phosphatidate cytidylyltransferase [Deltaproteobacteria bacterium]|nr:phosphatidate cytidylyltransferase [Deltaproteobacteria bacterium]MBW2393909.1 phosphatidate cytidylyltransferase [Deltaproteobacteria bacterium]
MSEATQDEDSKVPESDSVSGKSNGRKPRSNLTLRLITAALLIPPIIFVIFQPGPWVLGTVLVITMFGVSEFYDMIEAKGAEPLRTFGMTAAAALPVIAYLGSEYLATLVLSAVLLGVMVAQLGKARIAESLASISGTFFGVFYVGWLLSHAVVLRSFEAQVAQRFGPDAAAGIHPEAGAFYLFFTISVVIGGDVGAYFVGGAYGKRKLAPFVSPNKTVEGALGAMAAGMIVALFNKVLFDTFWPELSDDLGFLACAILAVVLNVVGILGDLVESLLKRDAQVKDSGGILPGTGGVLDRIDSNLLAIPVMYYLLLAYTFITQSLPG